MALDSDEDEADSFVSIGTAFEIPEKDEPRKKPFTVEDQFAVDSRGRRRFHGAFTGGFSAGFFNTVGSKEGFTPATFVSSRSKRTDQNDQSKPEDFMDDEDFGEFGIAPKRVFTKEKFSSEEQEINRKRGLLDQGVKEGILRSAIPGGIDASDFILPTKLSVGLVLLQKMGWKRGQGIGEKQNKKVFGCILPNSTEAADNLDDKLVDILFAPKDVVSINFEPKDNLHGLGYHGIDVSSTVFGGASSLSEIFKPTGKEKRGIRGQAFGVGAFEEEDDDIYERDNITEYDMTIGFDEEKDSNRHGWSGPPAKENIRGCLAGFIKAKGSLVAATSYNPPPLPRNFDWRHKKEKAITRGEHEFKTLKQEVTNLSAKERSQLLAENHLFSKSGSQTAKGHKQHPGARSTRWDNPSDEPSVSISGTLKKDVAAEQVLPSLPHQTLAEEKPSPRLLEGVDVNFELVDAAKDQESQVKNEDKSCSAQAGVLLLKPTSFKPFEKDEKKQRRYELFLSFKKSGEDPVLPYDRSMTEWEKSRELEEFHRASSLFRPMPGNMAVRFTHAAAKDDMTWNKEKEKSDRQKAASMGMYGSLTRVVYEWHPDGLLCKRFNIPEPYPGSGLIGINLQIEQSNNPKEKKDKSVSGLEIPSSPDKEEQQELGWTRQNIRELSSSPSRYKKFKKKSYSKEPGEEMPKEIIVVEEPGIATEPSEKPKIVIGPLSHLNKLMEKADAGGSESSDDDLYDKDKRPSMDLFKAIFADSDENEATSTDHSDGKESPGVKRSQDKVDEAKSLRGSSLEEQKNTKNSSDTVSETCDKNRREAVLSDDDSEKRDRNAALDESEPCLLPYGPKLPEQDVRNVHTKTVSAELRNDKDSKEGKGKVREGKVRSRKDKKKSADDDSASGVQKKHKREKKHRKKKKGKKHHSAKYKESADESGLSSSDDGKEGRDFKEIKEREELQKKKKEKKRRKSKHKRRSHSRNSYRCEKSSSDDSDSEALEEGGPQPIRFTSCGSSVSNCASVTSSRNHSVSDISDSGLAERLRKHRAKLKRLTAADFM